MEKNVYNYDIFAEHVKKPEYHMFVIKDAAF